ncbi:hypothetical protein [Rhizobium rhizogenes]|uniref:hypothetical protein n=1 Tax=Rhizobium rhizogenes TaxID=359 RepID=UPI001571F55A|nr:hypothetical protein [Rhizobium rhizogenes]NTF83926.1 hypothetical protein [Rhizobium rhizogenes]
MENDFDRLCLILANARQQRKTVSEQEAMSALGWNYQGPERVMSLRFMLMSLNVIQQRNRPSTLLSALVVEDLYSAPNHQFFEFCRSVGRLQLDEDHRLFWLNQLKRLFSRD